MEVRGQGINSLSYQGLVRITTKDNKGRKRVSWVYNSGTRALGLLICKSLIRGITGVVADDLKPYKINLIARGNEGIGTTLLSRISPISGAVYGSQEELPAELQSNNILGFVRFTSTIMSDSVIFLTNPPGLQLVIQDQRGTSLAFIDDIDGTLATMYEALRSQQAIIDWFMLIINTESQ